MLELEGRQAGDRANAAGQSRRQLALLLRQGVASARCGSAIAWLLGLACAIVLASSTSAGAQAPQTGPFAVGEVVVRFTDHSRLVRFPHRRPVPRQLQTVIRYPALGDPGGVDIPGAAPASAGGPFPLIVFAHGFDATPSSYSSLLRAWAQAGYVVAAPAFPLTNAAAPGGPKESDLVNQPRDVSFVISRILGMSATNGGVLSGLINPQLIAVSGHSDGGSTALAVAYNKHYVDHRIGAAMILSGAEIPGVNGYTFPAPSPALLAVQGTADKSNAPASTYRYFRIAPQPKFLLSLLGAGHGPPYTSEQPQLGIVERVTVAFLNQYLERSPAAGPLMRSVQGVSRVATLSR